MDSGIHSEVPNNADSLEIWSIAVSDSPEKRFMNCHKDNKMGCSWGFL